MSEEQAYLNLLSKVINTGEYRKDRTDTGTFSIFAESLKFNIRNNVIPVLTTKRVFWKGVVEELIFFLKGITNNRYLQRKGVHIWDGNSSREYLDSIGQYHRETGDLGAIYSHQWRHYGAVYEDCYVDYNGKGVDQIKAAIDLIKNDPTSRRIVVSAWNPTQLNDMALPPCHCLFQFYVNLEKKELNCQMYQRSADCFLGLPFNITSYALLTYIIADITGLKPGELTICLGDAHVYSNHIEQCKEQISRVPRAFPTIKIKNHYANPEDYKLEDFELIDYKPYPTIKAKMAI